MRRKRSLSGGDFPKTAERHCLSATHRSICRMNTASLAWRDRLKPADLTRARRLLTRHGKSLKILSVFYLATLSYDHGRFHRSWNSLAMTARCSRSRSLAASSALLDLGKAVRSISRRPIDRKQIIRRFVLYDSPPTSLLLVYEHLQLNSFKKCGFRTTFVSCAGASLNNELSTQRSAVVLLTARKFSCVQEAKRCTVGTNRTARFNQCCQKTPSCPKAKAFDSTNNKEAWASYFKCHAMVVLSPTGNRSSYRRIVFVGLPTEHRMTHFVTSAGLFSFL